MFSSKPAVSTFFVAAGILSSFLVSFNSTLQINTLSVYSVMSFKMMIKEFIQSRMRQHIMMNLQRVTVNMIALPFPHMMRLSLCYLVSSFDRNTRPLHLNFIVFYYCIVITYELIPNQQEIESSTVSKVYLEYISDMMVQCSIVFNNLNISRIKV